MQRLILGSISPRRGEILRMLGIPFTPHPPDFKEDIAGDPLALPERLAGGKALSVSERLPGDLVLGADTVVVHGGRALGKPADRDEAVAMLMELSGRTHLVISGVALALGGRVLGSGTERTEVTFVPFDAAKALRYVETGEPIDKAGAYGIQGRGAALVEKVNGCFYNVMGLPVQLTLRLLAPFSPNIDPE